MVKAVQVGPWGGASGSPWSYRADGAICNITLTYNSNFICSLTFTSKNQQGELHVSDTFGTDCMNEGQKTEVAIDTEIEVLKGIVGTINMFDGNLALSSLAFSTTKRDFIGLYGTPVGDSFSVSFGEDGGIFSGFYGCGGSRINSFGAILKNIKHEVAGPWGWEIGDPWSYTVKGAISSIKTTYSDSGIYSIIFTSKDGEGNLHVSKKFGERDGDKSDEIHIDTEIDALNGFSGTYDSTIVTSLAFSTVKYGLLGPSGTPKGTTFSYQANDQGVFGEFIGRSSWWLDSIGVVNYYDKPLVIDPWGGPGGDPWTYMLEGDISTIDITYDDQLFHSIMFTTKDSNGSSHDSPKFGRYGRKSAKLSIDDESLTVTADLNKNTLNGISGTIGSYQNSHSVTSLCFSTTNGRKFGPYGAEVGKRFSLPIKEGALVGFHGRSGDWTDAIGVILKPT